MKTIYSNGILTCSSIYDSTSWGTAMNWWCIPMCWKDACQIQKVSLALALGGFPFAFRPAASFPKSPFSRLELAFRSTFCMTIRTLHVCVSTHAAYEAWSKASWLPMTLAWTWWRRWWGGRRNHTFAWVALGTVVASGLSDFSHSITGVAKCAICLRSYVVGLNQLLLLGITRLAVWKNLISWFSIVPSIIPVIIAPISLRGGRPFSPIIPLRPPCIFDMLAIIITIIPFLKPDPAWGLWGRSISFFSIESSKGTSNQIEARWIGCLNQDVLTFLARNPTGSQKPVTPQFILKEISRTWSSLRVHGLWLRRWISQRWPHSCCCRTLRRCRRRIPSSWGRS